MVQESLGNSSGNWAVIRGFCNDVLPKNNQTSRFSGLRV